MPKSIFQLKNPERAFKKLEKDIQAIQGAIALGSGDVFNLAMKRISDKSFLTGVQKPAKGGRRPIFQDTPGGNVYNRPRRKNRKDQISARKLAFHRTKVVQHNSNRLKEHFQRVQFSKVLGARLLARANHPTAKIVVERMKGRGQRLVYEPTGRTGKIIQGLHYGRGRTGPALVVIKGATQEKNVQAGQRRFVVNGLRAAARDWNRYTEFRLRKEIRKRNNVRF